MSYASEPTKRSLRPKHSPDDGPGIEGILPIPSLKACGRNLVRILEGEERGGCIGDESPIRCPAGGSVTAKDVVWVRANERNGWSLVVAAAVEVGPLPTVTRGAIEQPPAGAVPRGEETSIRHRPELSDEPREVGPRDVGPREVGPREVGPHEVGPREVVAGEIALGKVAVAR